MADILDRIGGAALCVIEPLGPFTREVWHLVGRIGAAAFCVTCVALLRAQSPLA